MAKRVPIREGTFIDTPDGGILLANKCKSCGQTFFPKAQLCLSCFQEDMEEITLSRKGKLYSYTVAHMPSTHFEPPYAIGYVDMPEGVRVFAPLIMMEDKPLQVDMDMEMVIEKLWEEKGKDVIGYKFKPV